ncbi:MAG TPA: sialate O-acetylesterase, partial [Flavisolibacter sp.]
LLLQKELNVPIGLIHASWSGTPAEAWTPGELVQSDPALKKAAAALDPSRWWPVSPGAAFSAMLHPLIRFSIAGAIYYQGESNVGAADTYTSLMITLIGGWRKNWQKDFPFYFVQIAPYSGYGDHSSAAFLREAQTRVLSYPGTGMVLTSDLVDSLHDIHPRLKKEVGIRLANYALAETYHKQGIAYKSPLYQSMQVEKDKIRVHFTNAEGGLVSRGAPTEFYIAGEDRKFLPARARIEGSTVVVWSKQVKQPVAVRFGFRNAAQPNLFSKGGLPVGIFRTDNWPVHITVGAKQ